VKFDYSAAEFFYDDSFKDYQPPVPEIHQSIDAVAELERILMQELNNQNIPVLNVNWVARNVLNLTDDDIRRNRELHQ
jgi:hypothetical protein